MINDDRSGQSYVANGNYCEDGRWRRRQLSDDLNLTGSRE